MGSNFVIVESENDEDKLWKPRWSIQKKKQQTEDELAMLLLQIEQGKHCCMLRCEQLKNIYLVKKSVLNQLDLQSILMKVENVQQLDLILSRELRKVAPLKLMTGSKEYGQIVNLNQFPQDKKTPELFRVFENSHLWQLRYIEPDFRAAIEDKKHGLMNATQWLDTFSFKLFTDTFIQDFTNELTAQQKSAKKFPLWKMDLDIDMLGIINFFITPDLCQYYQGYLKPSPALSFNLHNLKKDQVHDFDPYLSHTSHTIILPLSHKGEDYTGGKLNFVRYNCSIEDFKKGTAIIFPGPITHLFEIEPIIKGTFSFLEMSLEVAGQYYVEANGGEFCAGFVKKKMS